MTDVPVDIRPDLAERYRQLRPFDEAEIALVRALVRRPDRLDRIEELRLRQVLNLARLWVVPTAKETCVVGPQLGSFREMAKRLTKTLQKNPNIDPAVLGPDARALEGPLKEARQSLLVKNLGRLSSEHLDREITQKALVLVVGGGGGCGYVHLGAFGVLERLGLVPHLIAGSSIGSILGLFRARRQEFQDTTIHAVTQGLTFNRMFRVLDSETQYAMPGALRLYLRSAIARFFENDSGETIRLSSLDIPFLCLTTGVQRDAARQVKHYENLVRRELRRGTLGRLLHLKDLIANLVAFLREMLATPGALRPIPLGTDAATREFDALDAVGFSSALPAVIQYDITRNDPRMHGLLRQTLESNDVDFLADGGIVANVPAKTAWEYVQSGHITTRNVCIVGLDCFAPQMGRNMLFLPLMRLASENVQRDSAFMHLLFTYRKTPAPTSLVPSQRAVDAAVRNGRQEFLSEAPFLQKMLEPLAPI